VVEWYPGEIPCCLPEEHPAAFERMKDVWAATAHAAAPFMAEQVHRLSTDRALPCILVKEIASCRPRPVWPNRCLCLTSAVEDAWDTHALGSFLGESTSDVLASNQVLGMCWTAVGEGRSRGFI
jgi:hypothetical protein